MKTAREYAIEWLYPGVIPNPAQLRRDEQVDMLTKRFERVMAEAHKEGRQARREDFADVASDSHGAGQESGFRDGFKAGAEASAKVVKRHGSNNMGQIRRGSVVARIRALIAPDRGSAAHVPMPEVDESTAFIPAAVAIAQAEYASRPRDVAPSPPAVSEAVKAGDLMWSPGTGKVAVVPSPYGAYSTVDGDLVRVDPTNGKITITLPLALPVTFRTLEAVKAWMALSDGQRDCYYTNAKRPLLGGSAYDGCEIAEVVLRELAVDEGAK